MVLLQHSQLQGRSAVQTAHAQLQESAQPVQPRPAAPAVLCQTGFIDGEHCSPLATLADLCQTGVIGGEHCSPLAALAGLSHPSLIKVSTAVLPECRL